MGTLAVARITLGRFRSYRAARLGADTRPMAFFGPNGAGKTNLLEALSLLVPGRGFRRAGGDEIARRPAAIGWKVTAEVDCLGEMHEVETWAGPGGARQVRINGKAATQTALGQVMRMLWLVPSMDRLWLESAEGRRRFLDRMTLSFFPDHAEASLVYDRAMRERNRLLRDGVGDDGWFGALEARMGEAGTRIAVRREEALARIRAAFTDSVTAFPVADLAITAPAGAGGAEDLAARLGEGRRRDMAAGRTLIGPHRVDLEAVYAAKSVAARLASTGEQKALLISLVLANARALAASFGAPPVMLLDEVAAHLDGSRRAALYDEICALGAQTWMTGTEAGLFEALGARARRFEVAETADGTVLWER